MSSVNSGVRSVAVEVAVPSVWLSVPSAVPPKNAPVPSRPEALPVLKVAVELVADLVYATSVTVTVQVAIGVEETKLAPLSDVWVNTVTT